MPTWFLAGGEYQAPFFGAISQALKHTYTVNCPRCAQNALRFYVHAFNKPEAKGALWAWGPSCRRVGHLPRLQPNEAWPDPFAAMTLEEFGQLEADEVEPFFDRLDRLWNEQVLGFPNPEHSHA